MFELIFLIAMGVGGFCLWLWLGGNITGGTKSDAADPPWTDKPRNPLHTRQAISVPIKVVGVTYDNPDGTDGQYTIAKHIRAGNDVSLVPEPSNPHDRNAVAVVHPAGQLGYVPREWSKRLDNSKGGCVTDVLVGEDGLSYGLRIEAYLSDR